MTDEKPLAKNWNEWLTLNKAVKPNSYNILAATHFGFDPNADGLWELDSKGEVIANLGGVRVYFLCRGGPYAAYEHLPHTYMKTREELRDRVLGVIKEKNNHD